MTDAVVVVHEGEADGKSLVGYVVLRDGVRADFVSGGLLIERLRARLPDYLCPTLIVPMTSFPLGSTGKVDRGALPDPGQLRSGGTEYVLARTEQERVLIDVCTDVLKPPEPIGVRHNFFLIGGDSLSAVRLTGAAAERGWAMALDDIFKATDLGELATAMRPAQHDSDPALRLANFTMLSEADLALLTSDE